MRTEWRGATFPAAAVGNRAVGRGGDRRKSPQVVRVLVGENRVREEMPLVELSRNKEGGRTAVVKARAAAAGVVVLR